MVGSVGAGKTSLLASLAGEMRQVEGALVLGAASRAFCPQNAWIQNATVRDNIVFGHEFDADWYGRVVDACALRAGLRILPAGDMTEIGERGITLSGGQKQRVNLARAIYYRSEIILMDDPLSAVDAHVGRHIFDQAICGLLQDRCRVLATHQLHVLSRFDRIVWMDDGRVVAIDTYDALPRQFPVFQALVAGQNEIPDQEEHQGEEQEKTADDILPQQQQQTGALMTAETKAVKSVPWSVYAAYVRASGMLLNALWIFILLVAFRGANIATRLWLSFWSEESFALSRGQYVGDVLPWRGIDIRC